MHRIRTLALAAGLLLLALPALAAETVQITLDSSSPRLVNTGLVAQEGDRFLVQAQGALRLFDFYPIHGGWFDPSGLGRYERASQVFADSPYGIVIGTFGASIETGLVFGELATFVAQPAFYGDELKLGLNLSLSDQASLQGAFKVSVTRFAAEEATEAVVTITSDSTQPVGTGIVTNDTDDVFVVLGQGVARTIHSSRPLTQGWFDASGLGRLQRVGQVLDEMPYGSLLGTLNGQLGQGFYLGDFAAWDAQPADVGDELEVGLNMSADDLAFLQGEIKAHVLRIANVVVSSVPGGDVPDRDAIVAVSNYPNPFNPMTTVRFELASQQRVHVSVHDAAGKRVRTLDMGTYTAGQHELTWDGRDDAGRGLASGTYLLRLETRDAVESRKLTLVQ